MCTLPLEALQEQVVQRFTTVQGTDRVTSCVGSQPLIPGIDWWTSQGSTKPGRAALRRHLDPDCWPLMQDLAQEWKRPSLVKGLFHRRLSNQGLRYGATSRAEQGAGARMQKSGPKCTSKLHVTEVTTVGPSLRDEGISPQPNLEMLNGCHSFLS